MAEWLQYSFIAIAFWAVVGLLQKLGTNRISAHSLTVWLTVGFVVLLPWFFLNSGLASVSAADIGTGVLVGVSNGAGAWCLFAALQRGAKASVAIPLTALYPLVTAALSVTFLGEALTSRQWIGLALAVVAGLMLSYEREPRAAANNEALFAPRRTQRRRRENS